MNSRARQRLHSFPLTGKDKGRGDGFDRSPAPLFRPFPVQGKGVLGKRGDPVQFSFSLGERKLM
jgi:hypothetical protein